MTAVISLFIVLLSWRFLIIFSATVFVESGLSPGSAGFEARSALVGAGYTTSESEYVVQNPVARKVASTLMITGYFGPAVVLGLLGLGFLIQEGEDLTQRAVTLVLLLVGLFLLDRLGLIRAVGSRPARAVARRMLGSSTFETWTVVGDHAVAALVVPLDSDRAHATLAALASAGVDILAVDPVGIDAATFPSDSASADLNPGDRAIVFGSIEALEPLRGM